MAEKVTLVQQWKYYLHKIFYYLINKKDVLLNLKVSNCVKLAQDRGYIKVLLHFCHVRNLKLIPAN